MTKLGRMSGALLAGASLAAIAFVSPSLAAPFSVTVKAAPAAPASTPVNFEVFLPLRNTAQLQQLLADQQNPASPNYQKWLTPAQFGAQFGPTQASLASVQAALKAAGLQITGTSARSTRVAGTAAQVNQLFQTNLKVVQSDGGHMRMVAAAKLTLPAALQQAGAQVVHFAALSPRHPDSVKSLTPLPANRQSTVGGYWYDDLKQAYDYPSYQSTLPGGKRLDGTGVKAAVLMEDLLIPGDLANFFNNEGFTATTGLPAPSVNTVLVDGGGSVGGPGSLEASLDVQQILGGAPGATVTLVSIPDLSNDSIFDGYSYIVANPQLYNVVNSSFGGCELEYLPADNEGADFTYVLLALEGLFQQGNAEGITFVASSGDEAGPACPSPTYGYTSAPAVFQKGISSPSDSPSVTAVGGGNLITVSNGSLDSTYVGENGFADPEYPYDIYGVGENVSGGYWGAGGGRSSVFTRPSYQTASVTGSTFRTNPDVGMQVGGCPGGLSILPCGPNRSFVAVAYAGSFYGVIGTSVSSPEFVGALALYIQKTGKGGGLGNVNPYLYSKAAAQTAAGGVNAPAASQFYHRNIQSFDGAWPNAYPSLNYTYVYGNGSPDVRKLFGFTNFNPAGIPQSASNP